MTRGIQQGLSFVKGERGQQNRPLVPQGDREQQNRPLSWNRPLVSLIVKTENRPLSCILLEKGQYYDPNYAVKATE